MAKLGKNITFPIYKGDGTSFHDLVLHKSTYDSVVMSLSDKITGEVYYKDNNLEVSMNEYINVKRNPDDAQETPVQYVLVNPPTIVREGVVSENGQLNGMTKYSFVFYHPMYKLGNLPFTDIAVSLNEKRFLSESREFNWIGTAIDYVAKMNKNLEGTEFVVRISENLYDQGVPSAKLTTLSNVLTFNDTMMDEALKIFYETYAIPYVVDQLPSTDSAYASGKRFLILVGLPYETIDDGQGNEFVFRFGQGVGLKNNSRTPRNNKIVTRVAGYGSEENIPYGYPQIRWFGPSDWTNTKNDPTDPTSYPIYEGIVGGALVKLIKHPFTRTHLMPTVYVETLFNKVSPYNTDGTINTDYDPNTTLVDYYDATAEDDYPNPINRDAPSYESHEFADIKPQLGHETAITGATPLNDDLTPATDWDDSLDDNGEYKQSYFKISLPQLSFDLYACAAITQEMNIVMRGGACLGCTFPVQIDWDEYKKNFYRADGTFDPVPHTTEGDLHVRDITKFPNSSQGAIDVIVKKENSTFGTLMPNVYQKPMAGDEIVFTGISLPQSYIDLAQALLDDAMKQWMLENNVHYWDYPLKFDEQFLSNNTDILLQLRPNVAVTFVFADTELTLYVKQLTIKYGEKVLPQYDITLTDNIEASRNSIGQAQADITKIDSGLSRINSVVEDITRNERIKATGSDMRPVYINGNNVPQEVKGIDVPENIRTQKNVEAMWGVSARGIATLETAGAGGGGTVTGIKFAGDPSTIYEPSQGLITLPDYPTAASLISDGLASQSYVQSYFSDNFTQANIKSTLGIYDWALATSKPSYNFSEIGSKPTTLAGYGITDAHITNGVVTLGGNTITPATLTNGKIPLSQIPDAILGQLIYGGTVNGSGVVTLSQNAKDKWGITSLTLTSTNYSTYEGAFFIASADATSGVPSTLGLLVGDWVVATASGWGKIDNTDAVTGIKGDAENSYRIGNVNITKGNIGLGNVENTALSTWAGTSNITTLGTIATGVWHGTAIGYDYLASGVQTSLGKADTVRGYFDTNGLLNKANHYSPASDSSADYSASASGATAAWSIDVVKGVQIQRDAKGHIIGVTVTSGKIPAKPSYNFSEIGSKPTTLAGYGITDGVNGTITEGNGNAITSVGFDDSNPHTLIFTKGTSFKTKQTAKSSPSASGNSLSFIDTISQDTNGVITATKKTIYNASATQSGIVTTSDQTFGGDKTFNGNIQSMKGVAARGIATLQIGGGGGSGTVTSIKFGSASVIAADNGLLSVPVGQGTSNGQIKIGGQDISVKGLAALAYLPSLAFGDLTTHPTTLGGYGITDAKIANGVITLGSNSITPLTGINASMINTALGFTLSGTSGQTYNLATISSNASNGNTAYGYFSNGVLPASKGGTGKTSLSEAGSAIINALGEGSSPATRNDYIVAQSAGGGTTTTSYCRRKLSNIFVALNSGDITTALGYTPYNATNPNGYISGNQTITLSGDVSGSGATSIAVTIGAGKVTNAMLAGSIAISKISGLQTALDNKLETSLKGAANGLAELDANGLVPSSQLPSYVDDVLEYSSKSAFPATGETGKIYVALDTNLTYRWSGTAYVEISPSLALGETSSTAYRGDRGKIAYDHSQSTHARTDATNVAASSTNGNIKINGTETTVYSLPTATASVLGGIKVGTGLGISSGVLSVSYGNTAGTACEGNDTRLSDSRPASDVYAWAKAATKPSYTASEVGALKNYGNSNSRPNGNTFTMPVGANPVSMRSGATSGADIGIFWLSDDNAFVCNSSDNGYLFAAFDTDKTADFRSASNAAFAVLSEHAGVSMKGNLAVAGSITSGGTAVALTNDSRLSDARPASDVYDWAKASTKPSYSFSEISSRQQAYIDWGGPNLNGYVSPIEVATIDDLGHNKFAFASAATITAQYSRDGGSTWTTFGADNDRRALLTLSSAFYIGNRTGSSNTTNDKLRIILNANRAGGNIYTALRRLLLYISTAGSGGCTVKVEHRTIANYNNNVDTWSEIGTYGISGWSGWNSIPCDVTFGGSSDQTSQSAQVRLTFGVTSVSSTYSNLVLYSIRGIGFPLWQSPSTMASTGHLYSYDISQNAAFPAGVSATSFTENGTALSSKYLGISAKAADSDKLDGNDSSYFATASSVTTLQGYFASGVANNAARLSNTSKIGDTNKPVYFTANGVPAAISYTIDKSVPSNALFTDANVKQEYVTSSGYTNWRCIPFGYTNSSSETFTPDTQTNQLYTVDTLKFQPSTGTLRTGIFKSTVATGTAPLVVASTTKVANLNADLLDGQEGSYYAVKAASKGSTTKPIYTDANGAFQECSTYAGDTAVTLNGSSKAANTASFYAPTGAGTAGQILKSTAGTPEWINQSALVAGKATQLETSRSLWGQSFNGTANVSGNISSVGNISFSASGKNIGGLLYFDTTNGRLGVGVTSPLYKLHVGGDIVANGGVAARGIVTLDTSGAGISGAVTQINVGSTPYTPTDGIVSLPASFPASDVSAWAKASSRPTYTTSIETSTGTNQRTLAFGTKYALNAGDTSYIFTMPSLPSGSTSQAGVVQLSSATNSTSNSLAATASAVKAAYDLASEKASKRLTMSTSTASSLTMSASTDASYIYWYSNSVTSVSLAQATSAISADSCGTVHYILFRNVGSSQITVTLSKYNNSNYQLISPAKSFVIPASSSVEISYVHFAASALRMTVVTIGDIMSDIS